MSFFDKFTQGMDLSATRVVLGTFEFVDFEVPERISLGAKQQIVVHKLVGGARVVDVLGVDYDAIRWSGIITGNESASRVLALEQIRDAGRPITFTLDDVAFEVVLSEFVPVYEFVYRRPYSLELTVIKRQDAPSLVDALTGSLDALVNGDIGKMLGLADIIDIKAVTDAVTAVQDAVAQVQDIANATVAAVQTIVRPIVAAQQIVHGAIAQLESAARDITTLGGLVPGNPVAKTVDNVLRQVDSVTRLPALYQMNNVLGRLNKNVQTGQIANGVRTITQAGGTLYQMASDLYGDASKWLGIAAANKMTDPKVDGIKSIIAPENPS